ncbi:MAG: pseudouridine synthase [Paludibacteraceae bacterium]
MTNEHEFRPRGMYNNRGSAGRDGDRHNGDNARNNRRCEDGEFRPRFNRDERGEGNYRQESHYSNGNRSGERRSDGGQRPRFERYDATEQHTNARFGRNHFDGNRRRDGGEFRPRFDRNEQRNGNNNYRTPYRRQHDDGFDENAKYSHKKQMAYKKQYIDYNEPMRLNKFLANAGICSRREADEYITAGVVTVNGEVVTELGTKIVPANDKVMFHDQLVRCEKRVYILLNKPKDCVTTVDDPHARMTVLDLVKNACAERIYPVGRLDRNTTGVLLLTNDGDLTSKMTHPKYKQKKIYEAVLDHEISEEDMQKLRDGLDLEDGEIHVDDISYCADDDHRKVGVEIHSGRNRIVRRMFDAIGYKVLRLDRVYFAGLTKKNLPRGKWRYLSEREVNLLKMTN